MYEELVELGLTKNQAKVYIELISSPEQTGGELAKKLSIDRSFTYGILKNLTDRGLVSHLVKLKKTVFSASNPENLLKIIDEKRRIASGLIEDIKKVAPLSKKQMVTEVFEGKESIKNFARELLSKNDFLLLGGGGEFKTLDLLKHEHPHYIKELKNKRIKGRIIASRNNLTTLKKLFSSSDVKIRILEKQGSQINFVIFGDMLAIYSSQNPFLIKIENRETSQALKNYFDILWKTAKQA